MTLMASSAAHAFPAIGSGWPTIGADASPGILIDLTSAGASVTATGLGPYDGADDTYVGVTNHTGTSVGFLDLASSLDIFGFDGDGLCHYNSAACATSAPTGYEGVGTFFSNITDAYHGRVNFIGGLGAGQQAFFSLEESLDAASFTTPPVIGGGVPEPASWALMLVGFFGLGGVVRGARRRGVATAVA